MSGASLVKTACITVLGSGFAPFAPGTWGSLVALALFAPIWFSLARLDAPRTSADAALLLGALLASTLSVLWGPWALDHLGARTRKPKDPSAFVLDEFVGQWLSLCALPVAFNANWTTLAFVAGGQFFLFRFFDVIKPPPARQLERLPAGWGILLDDVGAGLYANFVGQLVWRATPLAVWLGIHLTP